jgi:Exostosin family
MCEKEKISALRIYIPDVWRDLNCGRHIPVAAFLLRTQNQRHMGTWRDTFIHQMDFGDSCVPTESAENADFILFPYAWEPRFAELLADQNRQVDFLSQEAGRPVVCQGVSADILDPGSIRLPFKQGCYLSSTLVSTRRPEKSLGFSYFIPDCRAQHAGGPPVLTKPEKPSVGFCGVAAPFKTAFNKTKLFDYCRLGLTYATGLGVDPEEFARRFGNNTKHAYRARLIQQFRKNPDIDCDFVLRRVGGLVDNSYTNSADNDPYNKAFYRNLEANLYNICCRGTENYSVRFYETLCMGRIPVVVDTDFVLPFDDVIDYRKHCVWIERRDIAKAADILLAFHQEHSDKELREMQKANRILWESCLSHTGYYRQLINYLGKQKGSL